MNTRNPDQPFSMEDIEAANRQAIQRDLTCSYRTLYPLTQVLFNQLATSTNAWHQAQGFWDSANIGEKVSLIHAEIAEFTEWHRNGNPASDHLPEISGCAEELADTLIRVFDLAAHMQINLGDALIKKLLFNLNRPFKHDKAY